MLKTRLEFGSDDSIVLQLPKITVNSCSVLKFIQLEGLSMYSKQVPFEGMKSPSQSLDYRILRGTRHRSLRNTAKGFGTYNLRTKNLVIQFTHSFKVCGVCLLRQIFEGVSILSQFLLKLMQTPGKSLPWLLPREAWHNVASFVYSFFLWRILKDCLRTEGFGTYKLRKRNLLHNSLTFSFTISQEWSEM